MKNPIKKTNTVKNTSLIPKVVQVLNLKKEKVFYLQMKTKYAYTDKIVIDTLVKDNNFEGKVEHELNKKKSIIFELN